jgi:hypothetical protein
MILSENRFLLFGIMLSGAFPLLMESEAGLYDFDLTRFLHANRPLHFAQKRSSE